MIPLDRQSKATQSELRTLNIQSGASSWSAPDHAPEISPPPAAPRKAHLRVVQDRPEPHPVLQKRDPAFIRRIYPYIAAISDHYYRSEVEGIENMTDRASLIISTHNGGLYMPDMLALQVAFWRRFGMETPSYGMGHKAAIEAPIARDIITKVGAIYASPENARIVLDSDAPLLICPGGDRDSLKLFRNRHQIQFGKRMGFIRTALKHQVPIIPVVSVGAHEVFYCFTDGRKLAKLMRFDKLFRIKSVPMTFGFPLGVTPGGIFHLPLPSKVKVKVLDPIRFSDPASAADDPVVVERLFNQVVNAMQTALNEMASKRRWPVLG